MKFSTLIVTTVALISQLEYNNAFTPIVSSSRSMSLLLQQKQQMTASAVQEEESTSSTTTTLDIDDNDDDEFIAVKSRAEETLKKMIPVPAMVPPLLHFNAQYLDANRAAFRVTGDDMNRIDAAADRYIQAIDIALRHGTGPNKFQFQAAHVALRGQSDPQLEKEGGSLDIDFYDFGCNFFKPCMDMKNSIVLGQDNLKRAVQQVENGENVVFFANHQSEADPQVVSACFEKMGFAKQAADMVYVAGHKVTTDPLAVPFSMGRNLICIHSKKHLDANPEEKSKKQRDNLQAMSAMLKRLKEKEGCAIWVAPSGGRDRRNVETKEVPLAPFDSKTIDMFRLLGNKSKVPTHYYPMAMVSYELCPPPDYVAAGTGEERNVQFVPVGIGIGAELKSEGGLEGRHEFCNAAFEACQADYQEMLQQFASLNKEEKEEEEEEE